MLLEVENLSIEFRTEDGWVRAVDGISFSIEKGTTVGLVGESGCGKSVTSLSLLGLLSKKSARVTGKILLEGRDLAQLGHDEMQQVRGKKMAMIFQEPMTSLNPVFSIGDQIAEGIEIHFPELSKGVVRERVISLLKKVGISEPERRYSEYPHQMSGGMRQRVMIAMALACNPEILIADEPTTALDVTIQAQILDLIRSLQKEFGMTVLLITHDLGVVAEMVSRVIVMYAGKIVEEASAKELFSNPLHPYTKGLLASVPKMTKEFGKRGLLKGIPGSVPDLRSLPSGCRFHERCDFVKDHCRRETPFLEQKAERHLGACFEVPKL